MKTLLKCLLLFIAIQGMFSLHFDLNTENKRCYIEELFSSSVAVIKYKIWSTPTNVDKSNFINK